MTANPLRLIDRFRTALRGAAPRKLHRHHARENDGRIAAGVNQIADIPVLRNLSGGDRFDQECVSSIPPAPVPVENLIRLVKDRESGDAAGMRDLCRLIGWMVVDLLRSRVSLEVEIWMLRQQINVQRRAAPKKHAFSALTRDLLPAASLSELIGDPFGRSRPQPEKRQPTRFRCLYESWSQSSSFLRGPRLLLFCEPPATAADFRGRLPLAPHQSQQAGYGG
jgi:hypothetical protein